jgi:hypothetical protein
MRTHGTERERAEQIIWQIRRSIGKQIDMALIANQFAELVQIVENLESQVGRLSGDNDRLLSAIELGSWELSPMAKFY